jgi:hypothetical protein
MSLKTLLLIITGSAITIFTILVYKFIDTNNWTSDNDKAEQIFSKYIQENTSEVNRITEEEKQLKNYREKLLQAKRIVDSARYQDIPLAQITGGMSLQNSISIRLTDIRTARNIVYDYNTKNEKIQAASGSVDNTMYYAFDMMWDYLNQRGNMDSLAKILPAVLNDPSKFQKGKNEISVALTNQAAAFEGYIKEMSDKIKFYDDEKTSINAARKKVTENSRDKLLITMVIPVFAVILAIIILVPYLFREKAPLFNKLLDDRILIQAFTIFILVITILLLGIGGKLDAQTLGTLLGGISIYVLQKSLSNENRPSQNPPSPPPPQPPTP